MRSLTCLFVFIIFCGADCIAQKSVRTSGLAQVELTRDKTRVEVEKEAEDLAIINALERAFGRVIMQGNATYISNINTGELTESTSAFHIIANTLVKGECTEVIKRDFTEVRGEKIVSGEKKPVTEIRCEIVIMAKEISAPRIEYTAFPLACLNINCRKTNFDNNEDLYFYFKSPVSGYLTIFLDDGNNSCRLLPYEKMPDKYESGIPVKADMEYFFFSNESGYNYFVEDGSINRAYTLFATKVHEMNRLFVIFSKVPLNKPELISLQKENFLSDEEIETGYTLPKSLSTENFQRWLNKNRTYTEAGMQVDIIDITITR